MQAAIRRVTLSLACAAIAAPLAAQDSRIGIAVLPFENAGSYGKDKEDFEALRKGIAATLIFDLGRNPAVRVVDRVETQRRLDQQGLAVADRLDAATAARVGKQVGARYTITGSFIDLYGDFRVDARIVDVETGEILKVVRSDPRLHDRKDMFRMIESLAERITLEAKLPAPGAAAQPVVPTEALALYSRGLLYEDRGEKARAMELYRQALNLFPGYTQATEGLRRLGGS